MMEVVVTTGAVRLVKLQSNCYHQHPACYRPHGPPWRLTNSVRTLSGKSIAFHGLAVSRLSLASSY